ncbi:FAD-dependent oxidoreductase [Candidatus Woesearchaeota archaeon]|nr:FAD-dependent oxidoreductase [Candidatus Woesearchaeota archaeon]
MYETIIIGAGIAGMTAAVYASRKRMNFLIIADKMGGQFLESGEVLNYPGIKATTGAEFEKKMEEQLKFNNIEVKEGVVARKIEKAGDNFKILTNKETYEAKTVIIASGARPRELGVPGENDYKKKGLTYCAICDGPLFSDKEVAVIGGGDSALEAVDFLNNIAKKIYLVNIGEKLTAHEYLQEKVKNNPKVEIINNAKSTEVIGNGTFVTGLKYEQNGEKKQLDVQGIFVEIGRIPNTDFVKDFLKLDDHAHIQIDCTGHASVPGIWAAGDCASGHEYQYVIAAGQGCMCLLKAARYLAGK